jgi:hypothetical protein
LSYIVVISVVVAGYSPAHRSDCHPFNQQDSDWQTIHRS